MSVRAVRVLVVPLVVSALFFAMLFKGIPYARGYGWTKESLAKMLDILWSAPDWGHGFFVPWICGGLVCMQWRKLREAPIKGSTASGLIVLLGALVFSVGSKAETEYFGYAGIQILLAGVILWFWGTRVFAIVSFAWFFFLFTWPLPFLDSMVALPLRLVMSHTSHTLLNLLGTSNVQSGTAILSAPIPAAGVETGSRFSIDIADPCSGLHSLFALMMISTLAGYISLQNIALRWLLFFCAIPLAIAGNVVRIISLVWGTELFGNTFALGTEENPSWFHLGCGYVVYVVALCLLFGLIKVFNSARVTGWIDGLTGRHGDVVVEKNASPLPAGGAA